MVYRDPDDFLDQVKLDALTREVGRVTAAAGLLKINAGAIIRDGVILASADKVGYKVRHKRWRALYPVRELVHATAAALRYAAYRLDAEWERSEESLCAPRDGRRRHR